MAMAIITIKLTFCILIMALISPSYGEISLDGVKKLWKGGEEAVTGFANYLTSNKVEDSTIDKGIQKGVVTLAKYTGKELAKKYFGPQGETGFTWGWKQSKRYLQIAHLCALYQKQVDNPICVPPNQFWRQTCASLVCVVEIAMFVSDNTPPTCTLVNCDEQLKYAICSAAGITPIIYANCPN